VIRDEKDKLEVNPLPNRRLKKETVIVVLGSNDDINRLIDQT
jgi:trk system potassium uptake protein TrkA